MLKTMIYGILTMLVSVGGLFTALDAQNPLPGFLIAFGVIIWFLWGLNQRWKKADERRVRERLFEEYMRKNSSFRR